MYPKLKHRLLLAFIGLIGLGVVGVSTKAAKQSTKVDPLILERGSVNAPQDLRHHLAIWHSKENASDLFKAADSFDQGEFSRLDAQVLRESMINFTGNYWIRFEITNKDVPNDEWYLEFSDVTATDINLFTLDNYRLVEEQEADFSTVGALSFTGSHPVAKAYIPMGTTRTFFAQLTSHQAPLLNIRISNEPSLISNIFAEQSARTNFSAVAFTLLIATLSTVLLTRNLMLLFLVPIAGCSFLIRGSNDIIQQLQESLAQHGFAAAQLQDFLVNVWLFGMAIFVAWKAHHKLPSQSFKVGFMVLSASLFTAICACCLLGQKAQAFVPHLLNLSSVASAIFLNRLCNTAPQTSTHILFGSWLLFTLVQLCVSYAPGLYQPFAFGSEALAYGMLLVMIAVVVQLADHTIDSHLKRQRQTLAYARPQSHANIPSQAKKAA